MTLDQIKKHPLYPFLQYQTDDAAFLMLELFWTQLAKEAIGEDLAETAIPLMEAQQSDGNPILFFRLPEPARAVRVVLQSNQDGLPLASELAEGAPPVCYRSVAFFPDQAPLSFDTYPPEKIDALLVFCDMENDAALSCVMGMIRDFLVDGLGVDDIETRSEVYYSQLGYPDPAYEAAYWAAHPEIDDDDAAG